MCPKREDFYRRSVAGNLRKFPALLALLTAAAEGSLAKKKMPYTSRTMSRIRMLRWRLCT